MEWLNEAWKSFLTVDTQLLLMIAFMLYMLERTLKGYLEELIQLQREANEKLSKRTRAS
ncbi:MAG: hypothetical protein U1E46_11700 [Hyphomicrobiales bacterium]